MSEKHIPFAFYSLVCSDTKGRDKKNGCLTTTNLR